MAVSINDFSEHGQGNAMDNVILTEQDLVGTIFFRPTETLKSKKFYNLDNSTPNAYQNLKLPVDSAYAYDAKFVTASHNFDFDMTSYNAALQQGVLMEFEKSTRIIVDQDKRSGILDVSLADLLPYTWVKTSNAAGTVSFTQVAKAFSTYELRQTIQFGIAQKLAITMVVPDGLTFPAYAAAATPLLPGSGLPAVSATSTPADRGWSITLRFKSIEQGRKV